MDPFALLDHSTAKEAFDKIQAMAKEEHIEDANGGKPAQAEGKGNTQRPNIAAVVQEGDPSLSAGTKGEIGGVGVGIEGKKQCRNADQLRCQPTNFIRSIINLGEDAGYSHHQGAEDQTG